MLAWLAELPRLINPSFKLPKKYDLREIDKLTGIKNQGSTNACWAFATTSALESVLGNKKLVLDPFHLYYNTGYDKIDDIGQYLTAIPYYAAWKGPVLESSANQIRDISPLRNLVNLKHLIIGFNPMKDYSPVESYYHNLVNKDFELH